MTDFCGNFVVHSFGNSSNGENLREIADFYFGNSSNGENLREIADFYLVEKLLLVYIYIYIWMLGLLFSQYSTSEIIF